MPGTMGMILLLLAGAAGCYFGFRRWFRRVGRWLALGALKVMVIFYLGRVEIFPPKGDL